MRRKDVSLCLNLFIWVEQCISTSFPAHTLTTACRCICSHGYNNLYLLTWLEKLICSHNYKSVQVYLLTQLQQGISALTYLQRIGKSVHMVTTASRCICSRGQNNLTVHIITTACRYICSYSYINICSHGYNCEYIIYICSYDYNCL